MTNRTITGLFDSYDDAAQAVREIEALGIPHRDISIVASNADEHLGPMRESNAGPDAGIGAAVGAAAGGGAGLLAGLGMLAIPGIGPVVAAGWLVATATGAAVGAGAGAVAGGLIGSLTEAGVSEHHAHVYAESIRRGGTVVTARVADSLVAEVEAIVERYQAVDPDARAALYREAGWQDFDPDADPFTSEELKLERERRHKMGLRTL